MMGWLANLRRKRSEKQDGAELLRLLEVAQTPGWTAGWASDSLTLNADAAVSLPTAVARSRNLWRNNDYLRRYRLLLISNVLGPAGLRLQMRLMRGERPNTSVNDLIESAYGSWGKRGACDVTGMLTWQDIERVCLESLARDGEILARRITGGPHGFQLQLIDPVLLDAGLSMRIDANRRIVMGVEIDAAGRPLAYWIRNGAQTDYDGATTYDHVRLAASDIIHRFIAEEPGQVRGIPWTVTAAQRLWLVRDFEKAAAVASSNAAKRIGFFVSPNGEAPPGMADTIVSSVLEQAKAAGKILTADEVAKLKTVAEKHATTAPGTYDTLPDGYDFRPFESDYPHVGHGEYVKATLRGAASGLGVSYVSMGNDLESVNYSSARVGILEEREFFKWVQSWLTCALHETVLASWLERALLKAPELSRINMTRLDEILAAATWQPRRWAGIDPVKEANAAEKNLQLKLTSRRRLILERGEDPDEVFAEIAEEENQFGPVTPASGTTPNPAEDPEGETEGETDEKPARHLRAIAGA